MKPRPPEPIRVAVVCTVRNERAALPELLGSLKAQTRPPDEVVIVDGGSTDGTLALLSGWSDPVIPLRVISCPGANIAAGRNRAIQESDAAVIAVTDAGVRLDPGWLAFLVGPFEEPDAPDVVSGFFAPDPRTLWETALGATTLPSLAEVQSERFLPSSRSVAFRKSAWQSCGGYPEWLDYCEDLLFDLALLREGYAFRFAPRAVAAFRPRPDPRSFFLQYFRYARGDGKALLWTKRHLIRYATYLGGPGLLLLTRGHPLSWLALLLGGLFYCLQPWQRLLPWLTEGGGLTRLAALGLVPCIRLIGDCAKMAGYPVGLVWRVKHRAALQDSSRDRYAAS